MCVIETDQALTAWTMKGQGVVQSMRPLWRCSHTKNRESHPILAFGVHYEYLAIEFQQHFGARIPTVPFHQLQCYHLVITVLRVGKLQYRDRNPSVSD